MISDLLVAAHMEHGHLLLCEEAPVAAFDAFLRKSCEHYAVQLANLISEALEYAAHDAVLARVNFNAYLLAVSL